MFKKTKWTAKRVSKKSTWPKTVKLWKTVIKIKHPWATGNACRKMWYSSWCDPRCLGKLEKRWGVRTKRAALAKWLCNTKKKRK